MRKFMRTRAPEPHATPSPPHAQPPRYSHAHHNGHAAAHPANGHANGVNGGARRDDHHSTLSRYWSGSEGSRGALFEDPEFPPTWRSIGDKRRVQWLRPHELCSRPTFLNEEAAGSSEAGAAAGVGAEGEHDGSEDPAEDDSPHESDEELAARWSVSVGEVGDAHVCCAAAALALTPRLLARVAPPHCFRRRYDGSVRFNFWVFGAWREVAVDDRLPTRAGRPLYSRGALRDDFTLPLLEKAYAKLYGSYLALREGSTARALQDLSGGIVQSFGLRQPRALTFRVLNSAVPRSTLLLGVLAGAEPRLGLLPAAPYLVTGLARVREGSGTGTLGGETEAGALVRVRSVSGRGLWAGAWAPHSAEWRALPAHDRQLLAARASNKGDFWMSFNDFASSFTQLELVHVGPDDWMRERALHARRPWRAVLARRRWRAGYNAGGPPSCTETTSTNPQFHVVVGRGQAGGGGGGGGKCHVVVSVTQQYAPAARARPLAIGFCVYELPAHAHPRHSHTHLHTLRALDVTHECRAREVVTFFTLPAGRYLVVPHTRRAHTDAAFLLRILTDDHTDVWEVNEDNVIVRDISAEFHEDGRLIPPEVRASVIKMLGKREIDELDAAGLRAALKRVWRWCLVTRPSLELCRALVALRDVGMSGRVRAADLPALSALLAYWKHAYLSGGGRGGACARAVSAYRLRALLWAAGVTASNKVLECLVLRFAQGTRLKPEAYIMALARLHLAHERYRALDTKMKSNPLSLEEMILMTIYS